MSRRPKSKTDELKEYIAIARRVKDIIVRYDPKAKVYMFGSVVKGRHTAASDIDILVVTERVDLKYDMMVEVYRSLDAPIELHITTRDKFEGWYRRFIDEEFIEIG